MKTKGYLILSGVILLVGGIYLFKEFSKAKKSLTTRTKEENAKIIVDAKKHGNYSMIVKFDDDFLNDWANAVLLGDAKFVHQKTGKIHNTQGGTSVK